MQTYTVNRKLLYKSSIYGYKILSFLTSLSQAKNYGELVFREPLKTSVFRGNFENAML